MACVAIPGKRLSGPSFLRTTPGKKPRTARGRRPVTATMTAKESLSLR